MGVFTRIPHPVDGRELQIKGGNDCCNVLNVGDSVDWQISENYPGYGDFLDGVYDSYSDLGHDAWVIVKDHKIHAVVDRVDGDNVDLYARYELEAYKREWWPEALWVKKAYDEAVEQAKKATADAAFYETLLGKSDDEIRAAIKDRSSRQFINAMASAISHRMNYASIGRKIFLVEPLPDNAMLPAYDPAATSD